MEYIPYILLGIIILFLGMQILFRVNIHRLEGRPAPEVSDLLEEDFDPERKALFYFYGAHCPPCITMSPRIERLSKRYPNVFKVDVGNARELASRFGITATPTIILVEAGKIAKAMVGTHSERRLERLLQTDSPPGTAPG